VVVAGVWRGPASEAFLLEHAGSGARLERAADALDQAAAALSELAARLEHAQATWDRARHLAAGVGVDLGSPADAVDPAAMLVAGQALRLATAAGQEATAARQVAAAGLDQAARLVPVAPSRGRGGHPPRKTGPPGGARGHGGDGHGGPVQRMAGRALEAGAEVATATHHLVAAAEARVQAAGRLAATADDPAVRTAASRVAQAAGRPLLDGRVLGALPLFAPVLDFTASVSHGEPLPRALAGAVGSAVGADLGGRAGLAICGGEAAATQGVGLVVCPTLTAVGGALGAQAGKAAALHVYDELTGPENRPSHPERARPAPASGG
jgi:hypothetical protein